MRWQSIYKYIRVIEPIKGVVVGDRDISIDGGYIIHERLSNRAVESKEDHCFLKQEMMVRGRDEEGEGRRARQS